MYKISIISALCLLLAASCSKEGIPKIIPSFCTIVIDDRTDTFALRPLAEPILAINDFRSNRDQEAILRLVLLTDKLHNPVEEKHLPDGKTSEAQNENDEIDYREQLVYAYCYAVRTAIKGFSTTYAPAGSLGHSECFATVVSELEYLSKSTASQRTLIVFSDLQENSDFFNCYDPACIKLLGSQPKKVAQLLLGKYPLPKNLNGVTVYFVYLPLSREQDQRFNDMVCIYRQLLQERGARVIIQSQNTYYQP